MISTMPAQNLQRLSIVHLRERRSYLWIGTIANGKMSQRNQTKRLIQDNLEDVILFQSVKGYGLFGTTIRQPSSKTIKKRHPSFLKSATALTTISCTAKCRWSRRPRCATLTGQVPMFPLWTYGFWQSRERYKTKEIVGVVQKYRELGVPLDGIIQDWRYWGSNYLWNAMDFLNEEFSDPKKMMEDIHGMNAHIIISIWSAFGPHTKTPSRVGQRNMLFNFRTWPEPVPRSGLPIWTIHPVPACTMPTIRKHATSIGST